MTLCPQLNIAEKNKNVEIKILIVGTFFIIITANLQGNHLELKRFNNWAIQGNWPELVIFIDVPIDQLLERLKKRELDRFEREDRSFFERIYTGFHAMAAADPQRWMIVDGTPPKEELQATILQGVQDRLGITPS